MDPAFLKKLPYQSIHPDAPNEGKWADALARADAMEAAGSVTDLVRQGFKNSPTKDLSKPEMRRRRRAAAFVEDPEMERLGELIDGGKVEPTPQQRTSLGFYREAKRVAAEVAAEDGPPTA